MLALPVCFLMRDRKKVDMDGRGGGKELVGVRRGNHKQNYIM